MCHLISIFKFFTATEGVLNTITDTVYKMHHIIIEGVQRHNALHRPREVSNVIRDTIFALCFGDYE